MTKILDGKVVNEKIAEQLRTEIAKRGTGPKLVIIQVGDVPESQMLTLAERKLSARKSAQKSN